MEKEKGTMESESAKEDHTPGKAIVEKAHRAGVEDAKEHLPKEAVIMIIQNVVAVAKKEKSPVDAAKEIGEQYKEAGQAYVKVFAAVAVDESLQLAGGKSVRHLAETGFSTNLVTCVEEVGVAIHDYFVGNISDTELIDRLGRSGIDRIGREIGAAVKADRLPELSVQVPEVAVTPEMAIGLAAPIVGYIGLMGAYKEMKKALAEQAMAREERLKIEADCSEIITMIGRYRAEMEDSVSRYLNNHLQTFHSGFAAMDRAILENDADGFIGGNVEIQAILGYDVQFSNQEEFDTLMDADTAFKL